MSYSREERSAESPPRVRKSRSRASLRRRSRSRNPDSEDAGNPGNNLYVTGLSTRVTSSDLEKYFNREGKVLECHLVSDPCTRESRGFAFVTMKTVEDADRCVKNLNRLVLEGQLITVEKMYPKCESCGATCITRTTSNGINAGRKYYHCPSCKMYRIWVEQFKQCPCGVGQCKVRTAKTRTNNGRQFWCCPSSTEKDNPGCGMSGCGMFEWIEIIECSLGDTSNTATVNTEESSEEIGESSQTSLSYIKGYIEGVLAAKEENSRMFNDLLQAMKKLDMKNPDGRKK